MNPSDEWLLQRLPSTCPELAIIWIDENDRPHTDMKYQHYKTVINRRMKIAEKYGIVRWNGEIADRNGAKIWVRI